MTEELYHHPEYYDVAFSWDLAAEIEFFGRVFARHVPFPVQKILEPACGPGRFLLALPRHGYDVTGYDVSQVMVDYARRRIAESGDPARARSVLGDMRTAVFPRRFDAGLNSINSLGYLRTDAEVVGHFRNMGRSLRPGGVYVVHVSCAWDGKPDDDRNIWVAERDGIRVKTVWKIEGEDLDAKLSHQVCTMEIDDHGKAVSFVDRHVLRLWLSDDIAALAASSGALCLDGLYSEGFEPLPLSTRVTGEMGNVYCVLKVA